MALTGFVQGIIQNADQDIVDLVENVVKFHIQGNCLILVALPMSGMVPADGSDCFSYGLAQMTLRTRKRCVLRGPWIPTDTGQLVCAVPITRVLQCVRSSFVTPLEPLGVLTKPDLVTTIQQKTRWLDVIEGRAHPLAHGYYCTRQLDEDQRSNGITTAEARAAEADFFLQTLPWARSAHQMRFGTPHLVANLSILLAEVISKK